jgi:hypothetical protein
MGKLLEIIPQEANIPKPTAALERGERGGENSGLGDPRKRGGWAVGLTRIISCCVTKPAPFWTALITQSLQV